MRWTPAYHHACGIQKKIIATMESPETTPTQLAALANAWDTLEDRKRILRNKGLPKQIESGPLEKKKRVIAPIE